MLGCFYCLTTFNREEIKKHITEKDFTLTGLCPSCGVDSIVSLDEALEKIKKYEFNHDRLYSAKRCVDCDHWGKTFILPDGLPPEAVEDLKDTHRQCNHPESPVMISPAHFGCLLSLKDIDQQGG